jgi:hypothetical protein
MKQNNVTIELCSTPIIINGGGLNEKQRQPIMFSNQEVVECIKSFILELAFRINLELM